MVIKKYNSFINERLGIPDGIIKNAQNLFELIIEKLDNLGDNIINIKTEEDSNVFLDMIDIDFGNFKIKNVNIGFEFYPSENDFDLMSMGVFTAFTSEKDYYLEYDKGKETELNSEIKMVFVIKNNQTTYSDIKNYFLNDRSKYVGVLAHELKHMFDKYMFGKNWFHEMADYSIYARSRFGVKPIDEFLYLLYLTTNIENLVRSTEIGAQIEELGITKKEFGNFLKTTRLYENLKMAREFKYKDMKSDLLKNIDQIKEAFDSQDIQYDKNNDWETINTLLELIYINITQGSIDRLKKMLGISTLFGIDVSTKSVLPDDPYLTKYIKKKKFKNKDDFFVYWEKYINFESDKVFRKISKLYDMCKDDNLNPLQDKISKKSENSEDKSIVNPELYDKYVVGDKKIKKYESFKYTKKDQL